MHSVSALCRVTDDGLEAFDGSVVFLKTCEEQSFVVEVADDVHGLGVLLEASYWMLDDRKGMLVALGFETELGELFVQRPKHLLRRFSHFLDQLHQSLNAVNCLFLSNEVFCILGNHLVKPAHLAGDLLHFKGGEESLIDLIKLLEVSMLG